MTIESLLNMQYILLSEPGVSPQAVLRHASRNIQANFNIFEMTLQIEEFREDMENCQQCQYPKK